MDIAIVGLGARLPGCDNLMDVWHKLAYEDQDFETQNDPPWCRPSQISGLDFRDHIPHDKACFGHKDFKKPWNLDLSSDRYETLDPLVKISLDCGRNAFFDCQWQPVDGCRARVILGHMAMPTIGSTQLARDVFLTTYLQSITAMESQVFGADPSQYLVASLPATVLGQALGFQRAGFSVDTGSLSALSALEIACRSLETHDLDFAISGGVAGPEPLYAQMSFTQLGLLSNTGHGKPFSRSSDGLVLGSGGVLFALKRLADAKSHGDHVYGVIRSCKTCPQVTPGTKALEHAHQIAAWDHEAIDYLEGFGTGVAEWDRTVLRGYEEFWQQRSRRLNLASSHGAFGFLQGASGGLALLRCLLSFEKKAMVPTPGSDQDWNEHHPNSILCMTSKVSPWAGAGSRKAGVHVAGLSAGEGAMLVEDVEAPIRSQEIIAPRLKPAIPIAIVGVGVRRASSDREIFHDHDEVEATDAYDEALQRFLNQKKLSLGTRHRFTQIRCDPELHDCSGAATVILSQQCIATALSGVNGGMNETGLFWSGELCQDVHRQGLRWLIEELCQHWNLRNAGGLDSDQLEQWIEQVKDTFAPALHRDVVMEWLSSYQTQQLFSGPLTQAESFACGLSSGLVALEQAVQQLSSGLIQQAIVGASDLATASLSAVSLIHEMDSAGSLDQLILEDASICLVLKSLDQAQQDGDTIWATIDGFQNPIGAAGLAESSNSYQGAATGLLSFWEAWEQARTNQQLKFDYPTFGQGILFSKTREGSKEFAWQCPNYFTMKKLCHEMPRCPPPPQFIRPVQGGSHKLEQGSQELLGEWPSNRDFISQTIELLSATPDSSPMMGQPLTPRTELSIVEDRDGAMSYGLFSPRWHHGEDRENRFEGAMRARGEEAYEPLVPPDLQNASSKSENNLDSTLSLSQEHLLELSSGHVEVALGEAFRAFDDGRQLTRIPQTPYSFLSSVSFDRASLMQADEARCQGTYILNSDLWFLGQGEAEPPFFVILECGLQTSHVLSLIAGSPFQSGEDLYFRHLQGQVTYVASKISGCSELTIACRCRGIQKYPELILQDFEFDIRANDHTLLSGLCKVSLSTASQLNSLGDFQNFQVPALSRRAPAEEFFYSGDETVCLIDHVEPLIPRGGAYENGRVKGYRRLSPDDWYFHAHYKDDPVFPTGLALQMAIHLAQHSAKKLWPTGCFAFSDGCNLEWLSRGQVRPYHDELCLDLHIHRTDDDKRSMTCDVYFHADGQAIGLVSGLGVEQKQVHL
ncbi:beta-ketoacyl synthase N-terminal-like domain-containing protein [Pseudobacteriovorax antillogorgiicola]|uniref:Beta-ketoacyl synthase, C-terminal domain n=1 Tax=Pseudobacteriovorax antillogorgiicola TaxID=1513793 RepID=A0A1Y6C1L2_9BACT|nr:beta-ketoacyl synthase N-terminal-like domain-containing protein [Pseudobacteriovorax antillogorgiicola]TCS52273.1 beta-ketoacyl synthase-like protein [Pseudobacteriovorax antillogorgiicola]SMF30773.1 Beta-ketoacyl synthase, C-terminal domain [Pseudobacteriovorax antillogorgiicola]